MCVQWKVFLLLHVSDKRKFTRNSQQLVQKAVGHPDSAVALAVF